MPTLNEAGNIGRLIQCTVDAIQSAGINEIEIIVVDDDSPDRTWEIASQVVCPPARVEVIRRMQDHGLTASLSDGIKAARHAVIVWLDCDFSHPPERIPQMLYMLDQGFDVAVNSSYVVGGGEDRSGEWGSMQMFLSLSLNWFTHFFLDASFADYTADLLQFVKRSCKKSPCVGIMGNTLSILFFEPCIRSSRYVKSLIGNASQEWGIKNRYKSIGLRAKRQKVYSYNCKPASGSSHGEAVMDGGISF